MEKLIANPQMDEDWKGGTWWKDVFEYVNENYDKYETSGGKNSCYSESGDNIRT